MKPYKDLAEKISKDLENGEGEWQSSYKRVVAYAENDLVILKIDRELGNEVGWVGVAERNITSPQEWGTLYGFPEHILKLPSVDRLANSLMKDAERNKNNDYRLGVVIDYNDAIKGEFDQYKGLFSLNDDNMYMSYGRIGYGVYSDELIVYKMAADSGSSGGPVILSRYNFATGKYESFVCGVHVGYIAEDEIDDSITNYDDLVLYIKNNITGQKVNFNYDQSHDDRSHWAVKLDTYGYSCARAVDKNLIKYLKQEGLSTCEGFNPYN